MSVASPTLVGCGGATAPDTVCGITSNEPASTACYQQSFAFRGSAAACGATSIGDLSLDQCKTICPTWTGSGPISCGADWTATPLILTCSYSVPGPGCGTGRRPAGLKRPPAPVAPTAAGRILAEIAHLEAASVAAFGILATELEKHRAPRRLQAESLRAAREEMRHAVVMKKFAERAGAQVAPVSIARRAERTIEAMALENAIEGCVSETFGAAVAHIQAKRANDRRVRSAMKWIAADETRHAQLSWELAAWFDSKLTRAGRRRVREARKRAGEALARSVGRATDRKSVAALGLPTHDQAAALINELRRSLWT
jgi:hypothetical protein